MKENELFVVPSLYEASSGCHCYLWLSKALANERRCYICNVFSHWLIPCSAIDRKQDLGLFSVSCSK